MPKNEDFKEIDEINEKAFNTDALNAIEEIINSDKSDSEKKKLLLDYHENDIATVVEKLDTEERIRLYKILGTDKTAEVFSYLENVPEYVDEVVDSQGYDKAADIIEQLDADDAIDILDELEDSDKEKIIDLMEGDIKDDVKLLDSYSDDVIGALMTTNFIKIPYGSTVKEAMKSLVSQAADNDNVSAIYVVKDDDTFYGTIDLRDLIIIRDKSPLDDIIHTSYPTVYTNTLVDDCLNELKEYYLDSIPVLDNDNKLVGVITQADITESVSEQLTEDYAKLAGLSEDEELSEPLRYSIKKRIPWLIVLMLLGILESMLTGTFELVIATLPAIVFFQTLVLGMAGNVGTQSLAVTIRQIAKSNDNKLYRKLIFKEVRIGFINGLIVSILTAIVVCIYLGLAHKTIEQGVEFSWFECLKAGGIVGVALLTAMTLASFTGTVIPIILTKCKIDPAVASGPFMSTINDIIAICVYYSLAYLLFILL